MKKFKYRMSGYTLIEVLVVMTIIGILFSVGYASYRSFSRRQTLLGIAKQVEGDLRLAQQMSLSGEKPAGCTSSLDGIQFGLTLSASSYEIKAVCGATPLIKSYTLPDGISFDVAGFQPNPTVFKVLGQGTNIPNGSIARIKITQQSTNNSVTISINSGGSIK